jgi:hypothetical protein
MEKIGLDKLLSALTEAGFELVFLEDKIRMEGIITLQIPPAKTKTN